MKSAGRIALAYLVVAIVWISASDWFFARILPENFEAIAFYKRWAFVAVSAAVIYAVLVKEFARRELVESRLRSMAVRDPLTGLLNRVSFTGELEEAVSRAKRYGTTVGVIFIDLDGFKEVNDAHGHHIGDELLMEAARRLAGLIRIGDVAARFGGDEFVVMVQGDRHGEGIERLAARLVEELRKPFASSVGDVQVTASLGFSILPDHADQAESLMRVADLAMYRAKSMGKDIVVGAAVDGAASRPRF